MPRRNHLLSSTGRRISCRITALTITALSIVALPAGADWLITLEGKVIETDGPWTIDGETLTYTDADGAVQTIAVDDVDVEASEETTAIRAGRPYEPSQPEAEGPGERKAQSKKKRGKGEKPAVILYMTTLCRQCTLARELLEELEVDFVAKDINTSKKARMEYRKKTQHGGGGLPVLDIGGAMVFSYTPRAIRQRVESLLEKAEDDE